MLYMIQISNSCVNIYVIFVFFFLHNLLPLPLLYKHLLSPITSSRNNSTLEKSVRSSIFRYYRVTFFCNKFLSLSLALNCLELVTWVIIVFVLYGSVKYACLNTEKEEKRTKKSSSLPQSYFSRKGLKRARLFQSFVVVAEGEQC